MVTAHHTAKQLSETVTSPTDNTEESQLLWNLKGYIQKSLIPDPILRQTEQHWLKTIASYSCYMLHQLTFKAHNLFLQWHSLISLVHTLHSSVLLYLNIHTFQIIWQEAVKH